MKKTTAKQDDDYDYIVKIVLFLQNVHGIVISISCRDFDILYRWWEKAIPLDIVQRSISSVVERRRSRNKKITGFSTFVYEVRKNFKQFFEMQVGKEGGTDERKEENPVERFFRDFPDELKPLRRHFDRINECLRNRENPSLEDMHEGLLTLFEQDRELAAKSKIFIRALSPELRTEKMVRKYRINYLLNRYRIPDFSIERSL